MKSDPDEAVIWAMTGDAMVNAVPSAGVDAGRAFSRETNDEVDDEEVIVAVEASEECCGHCGSTGVFDRGLRDGSKMNATSNFA